jgi:cobalt-zinc-cadmium efflux system outer membrane protein
MIRRTAAPAALLLLAACAGDADPYGRDFVSRDLEARTGRDLGPGGGVLPPEFDRTVLTEECAVAIALWNNAAFQEALVELRFKRADLVQSGFLANPVLSVLFPWGSKQLEFAAKFPLDILVFMPARIEIAELEAQRAAGLLVQGGLDLIRDVRSAWADLALARRRAELSQRAAGAREEFARVSEARLRAGDASELEISAARAAALRARQEADRSAHDVALAETRIRSLLGLGEDRRRREFATGGWPGPIGEPGSEALVRQALASRPDLRAAELAMETAGKRADLAPWEILSLSGILDANDVKGRKGLEVGPGAEVTVPIFDWGDGRQARAGAELERSGAHYLTVRHAILREVAEARTRHAQALETMDAARLKAMPGLEEAERLARAAYDRGETSILPVLEARERVVEAELRLEEAAADVRRAAAQLERSVGGRIEKERKP